MSVLPCFVEHLKRALAFAITTLGKRDLTLKNLACALFFSTQKNVCRALYFNVLFCLPILFALHFLQGKDLCGVLQSYCFFGVWFSRIFETSHWNACGMVWASAVTWHNPIPPYGRLAELACTGAPSARLQEHFGGNWVMPRYSRRPNNPTSISVSRDFVVYPKDLCLVGNATRW